MIINKQFQTLLEGTSVFASLFIVSGRFVISALTPEMNLSREEVSKLVPSERLF